MRRTTSLPFWIVAAVSGCWAAPTVQILTERPSPQLVGTVIGITALGKDEGELQKYGPLLRYRFSVAGEDGTFHIVRDFSRASDFAWLPKLYEHEARIKVTVLNTETKLTADAELPFRITPRVTGAKGQTPVVVHTSHPLVALFSFPACPEGSQFRVAFERQGDTITRRTGLSPCRASKTSNLYVAGMRADSDYSLHAEVLSGGNVKAGPPVPFHTGLVDEPLGQFTVAVPQGQANPNRSSCSSRREGRAWLRWPPIPRGIWSGTCPPIDRLPECYRAGDSWPWATARRT
jgi:hypothetical protein